jgi:hypothetical protein
LKHKENETQKENKKNIFCASPKTARAAETRKTRRQYSRNGCLKEKNKSEEKERKEKKKKRRKLNVIEFTSTQVASFIAMERLDD